MLTTWMFLLVGLVAQDGAKAADATLKVNTKHALSGGKIRLTLTLPKAADAKATDTIEVQTKEGSAPVSVKLPSGAVIAEAATGGAQKRTVEWSVPELPPGKVKVFWKCGDQTAGPAELNILKVVKKDWSKATVEDMQKAAVLMQTDMGDMLLEFYPDKAPETVRNFLKLTSSEFYDGVTFHRIIENFMIQGGDPTGTGTGDPGYKIKAEFNDLKHTRGVISMARSNHPDSAGCQFFIVHGRHAYHLDNKYTGFGKLIDGVDTLNKIATVPTVGPQRSKPKDPVYMRKVRVVEKP